MLNLRSLNLIAGIDAVHGIKIGTDELSHDECITLRLSEIYVPGLTQCSKTSLNRTVMTNLITLPFANLNLVGPVQVFFYLL